MTSKELEDLILWRATTYDEPAGKYMLNRYGVMGVYIKNQWTPIISYPDFEMVIRGRQFVFDVKVCSQTSLNLTGGTSKAFTHQFKFMRRKLKHGVFCFILLHFNERKLKTKQYNAVTFIVPLNDPIWDSYENGELKTLTRMQAELIGLPVEWDLPSDRCKKVAPNLYKVLENYVK